MALLLLSVASAHPGRTDGRGGHYDSATGEYHYHHGYRAHQHTDLDGDGKADCPYNFDDQTGADLGLLHLRARMRPPHLLHQRQKKTNRRFRFG